MGTNNNLYAGIDVGGTNIKIGILNEKGLLVGNSQIPTAQEEGPEHALLRIKVEIDSLLAQNGFPEKEQAGSPLTAAGIITPGPMDIPAGLILTPENLPAWRHFPIRQKLSDLLDRPVSFTNDANGAALGEYWYGGGDRFESMVMLTLGTGVGGGIVLGGRGIEGEHSFGAECGHLIIDHRPEARLCSWGGGRGHLEAYTSAPAVVARTQEALEAGKGKGSLLEKELTSGAELSTKLLAQVAQKGDSFSLKIIEETADYLAVGVTTLAHLIDPNGLLIGGAMTFGGKGTELGDQFLSWVREGFKRRTFAHIRDKTEIEFAQLGGQAGFYGAAGLAKWNELKE
ncbi:MAG: ROK family protein [Pirellulaceae bacterium]|nr:ROK family protein [Pirellulaceae bacterium]